MIYLFNKRSFLILLVVVITASVYAVSPDDDQSVSNRRIERVKPVLIGSEQMNRIIIFVSENCELVIPPDRKIDGIEGRIYCTFTVDSAGCVNTAWITKGINYWLDHAVADAIMKLPPWKGYLKTAKHDVVFSFISHSGLGFIDPNMIAGEREDAMKKTIDEHKQKESKEVKAEHEQWAQFRNDNMVETITTEHKKALRGHDADMSLQNPSSIENLRRFEGKVVGITVSPLSPLSPLLD